MDEIASCKKKNPVVEDLFIWSSQGKGLIGSRCQKCGEVFFPSQAVCSFCSSTETLEIILSGRGNLSYYTCLRYPAPGYNGPMPLCIGFIRLAEGISVISPLANCNVESLKMGMEMEMMVQTIEVDPQGNELMGFAFSPADKAYKS